MAAAELWDERRRGALGNIWLSRGGWIGRPSIRGHGSSQCDRREAPLLIAKFRRLFFQGCRRSTAVLSTAANHREVKHPAPSRENHYNIAVLYILSSNLLTHSESHRVAVQGYTNHVVYILTHAIQYVFLFRGGWLDCQRKPFGRAQRYLLHLLVRTCDKAWECSSLSSLISSLKYLLFFNLSAAGSQWAWWLVWPIWFCPKKISAK